MHSQLALSKGDLFKIISMASALIFAAGSRRAGLMSAARQHQRLSFIQQKLLEDSALLSL